LLSGLGFFDQSLTIEYDEQKKCIKCNKVTEIDECPFDVSNNIEGYKIVSHSLMIDGICDNCQK
jgi:Fe2+ or Zn2+ uptake regulation protein